MKNRFLILCNVMVGYCMKWKIDVFGPGKICTLQGKNDGPNLIVSLTSYGRRVRKTVYYTLVSLLRQSPSPDRIILWLSSEKWTEDNLPQRLRRLERYGVEYKFCDDIRSYTKLIPSLKTAPKDVIVTVDDDILYPRGLLRALCEEHERHPSCICCIEASLPLSAQGKMLPYKKWKDATPTEGEKEERVVFPLGVGAVLYPPESLHEDVFLQDRFMSLCPCADDIWFWVMARKKGTAHRVVDFNGKRHSFDALYQFFHKDSYLAYKNRKKDMNDVQMEAVLKEYPVLSASPGF
ncbi:MAG: glycosyltransferase family 2 protein [Bacteroides sp.]|nr:glycosyltransferase family 2 protein [Bacteroides sp.]